MIVEYCWISKKVKADAAFRNSLYRFSGGITFFAIANFVLAQYRILTEGDTDSITDSLLESIASDELAPFQRALNALQSRQRNSDEDFQYLFPKDLTLHSVIDPQTAALRRPRATPSLSRIDEAPSDHGSQRKPKRKKATTSFADKTDGYKSMKEAGDIRSDPSDFGLID